MTSEIKTPIIYDEPWLDFPEIDKLHLTPSMSRALSVLLAYERGGENKSVPLGRWQKTALGGLVVTDVPIIHTNTYNYYELGFMSPTHSEAMNTGKRWHYFTPLLGESGDMVPHNGFIQLYTELAAPFNCMYFPFPNKSGFWVFGSFVWIIIKDLYGVGLEKRYIGNTFSPIME